MLDVAYTVEDGKGGAVHLNVSILADMVVVAMANRETCRVTSHLERTSRTAA
jgi:hypothetical protein